MPDHSIEYPNEETNYDLGAEISKLNSTPVQDFKQQDPPPQTVDTLANHGPTAKREELTDANQPADEDGGGSLVARRFSPRKKTLGRTLSLSSLLKPH